MSYNINQNDIFHDISINKEPNLNLIILPLKKLKQDNKNKNEENNISSSNLITFKQNSLNDNARKKYEDISINREMKENISSSKEKKKIFKVNYRMIHDGYSPDNIKQIIIKHFINFFKYFINYIISKKINEKEIKFQISYRTKNKIKLKHINELTVEHLLLIEPKRNINNKNSESFDYNEEKLKKEENIKKIRKIVGISLDKLFETKVIDLFKNIYFKDINDENDKNIDLNIYGIEGIDFMINEDIPTYKKLKDKFKDDKIKLKIMDDIINSKIINPPKANIFKVAKK